MSTLISLAFAFVGMLGGLNFASSVVTPVSEAASGGGASCSTSCEDCCPDECEVCCDDCCPGACDGAGQAAGMTAAGGADACCASGAACGA